VGVVAEDACCACHLGASLHVLVHRLCACTRAREADSYAHGIVAYRHTRIHEQMRTHVLIKYAPCVQINSSKNTTSEI